MIKSIKNHLVESFENFNIRRLKKNPCSPLIIKTYWFCNWANFGDLLMPALLMRYGILPYFVGSSRADLIGIGTHFHYVHPKEGSTIWGTGIKNLNDSVDLRKMNVLCLRGYKTLERVKISSNSKPILCDPGILCSDLIINQPKEKKYRLGVVLHFQDERYIQIRNSLEKACSVTFIDINLQPLVFLMRLLECHCVLTSSLHCACAAESFQIPCVLLDAPSTQGSLKYEDFYSAFNQQPHYLHFNTSISVQDIEKEARNIEPHIVAEKKELLRASLSKITEIYSGGYCSIVFSFQTACFFHRAVCTEQGREAA